VLSGGDGSLHAVIARLRTRFVDIEDERIFANVNTPDEYVAMRNVLS
jgi:molybdopterin-guanine dinucleotide biosynthesis protein A